MALAFGLSLGCLCLIVLGFGVVIWWRQRRNKQAFFDVKGTCLLYDSISLTKAIKQHLLLYWETNWITNPSAYCGDISDKHHEEISLGNLKRFHFRELQIATNNFSSKYLLGKGGFGHVYKGTLCDGTVVAVKRLKDGSARGGEIQFQTEVEMISLAVHRNLLRLFGFCITPTERLLVYPYMSNGSVASRLKGTKSRERTNCIWSFRMSVMCG